MVKNCKSKIGLSTTVQQNLEYEPVEAFANRAQIKSTRFSLSALEQDDFPFESISEIAGRESWRKEINRPVYHIHKWWAHRLGTVFRAIVIGALSPPEADVVDAFYQPIRLTGKTVFDPFMGSGTTVGESAKLGARAIGRDINPVAHFLVQNALSSHDRLKINAEFKSIETDVAQTIRSFYKARLSDGQIGETLYYFWVKTISCPNCGHHVDLCSSRIFARHVYPKRYPKAQATCPDCGGINTINVNDSETKCTFCRSKFNPHVGTARGQKAICPKCKCDFQIAKTIRETNKPPSHRMYAKLVQLPDGSKAYTQITDEDRELYSFALQELNKRENPYPVVKIESGQNTDQILGYNYRFWHELFNDRQLLCLSILADRIRSIQDLALRDLFTCLFSGTLEFNNMFASYKGEGTGAVRHMFAHHILKPERVPLEANLWGTAKSSGSFMTMFEGRIRRALDYSENPFELAIEKRNGKKCTQKVFGLSEKLGFDLASNYEEFLSGKHVYLSCGDSSSTDLADQSVDAVITDPPFFDNVHYSQLADFFYVWQLHILGNSSASLNHTTRSSSEVQNKDASQFTCRLGAVWSEANRVLKKEGVLVFTYHHSRTDGWHSMLEALMKSGFGITAVHPIKAEMSVAMPKHQAKEPIDIDIIVACRKRHLLLCHESQKNIWKSVATGASKQTQRYQQGGRRLSRNDVRVIIMAQFLKRLSVLNSINTALRILEVSNPMVEETITNLYDSSTPVEVR